MRLIDADPFGVVSLQGKSEDFIEGAKFILEKIDKAPTLPNPCGKPCAFAELTEERAIDFLHDTGWMQRHYEEMTRPHGEWGEVFEHLGTKYHKCMNCYTGIKVDVTHQNFCPECGADMREGEEK